MKSRIFVALASVSVVLVNVVSAQADVFKGTIVAYDRVDKLIVMKVKTIYELGAKDIELPTDLKAGDRVEIDAADGGEDGVGKVLSIKRLN